MKTSELKIKYEALQAEAKALAGELKPLVKRYNSICKKATALAYKADNDNGLYRKDADGDNEPDGWNIHILFRLSDFEDDMGFLLQDAHTLLLNLADQPFNKR